ncbi:MAG: hypothetical protein A2846_00415 [Candidatus Doudnabacteria bacterium RIFCSPHIGHO2_01_FULL_49_9]|uniref:Uncharacterized protein n=1 Tax=Candidatus Doudnabacteria bacterium RIFCSPHIGHO2_01_FULL_49_9 TaxID=1817827 RepID=A0A1F5NY46_9BACT|nr:MAG: hypothetical protein A2846_00415 [Candidatus Doudnabacteria bacterium RIFCSPHIGHO2_01_FULL_49_9]
MWDKVTIILGFTGVQDKAVWQDVFISALVIPVTIYLGSKILKWWNNSRPSRLILKDYLSKDVVVYIFHSEMSSADNDWNKIKDPKYITRYPQPIPTDHANLGVQKKYNIDPISSLADAEGVADVFNILGSVQKIKNIHIGDLISDWNIWSNPVFSIGFNPKTHKFREKCEPIFFDLDDVSLKIKNSNISFDSYFPNDAGIIQKTFDKESKTPVIILAGMGTLGTSAASHLLRINIISLGKVFGNNPFCVFFTVKTDEGKNSATIRKITPLPKWFNIISHPLTYFEFKSKDYFIHD